MCWKPRDNDRLSQSKGGIKHQSCLLKSFGYYGKSIKSVWKARHAIRQPSTPPAQHSHIPAIHSTLWWGAHPDSTGRALTGHASPCTVPCPLSSAVVPAQWGHPQPHLGQTCLAAGLLGAETHTECAFSFGATARHLLNLFPSPTTWRQKVKMFLSKGQAAQMR